MSDMLVEKSGKDRTKLTKFQLGDENLVRRIFVRLGTILAKMRICKVYISYIDSVGRTLNCGGA